MYTLLKPLPVRQELLKRAVTILTPQLNLRAKPAFICVLSIPVNAYPLPL